MTVGRDSRFAAQTGGSARPARTLPNNTRHSTVAVLMLGQRRRRWTNIETTLGGCLVFAGCVLARIFIHNTTMYPANTRRCANVGLLMGRRRRRGANIKATLARRPHDV